MTENDKSRSDNLLDLFDMALDESSEEEQLSPLYSTLEIIEKRYLDPELINSGGMKKIYKVFDSVAGRFIAMAKLHEGVPKETYDPFICEARLTGLLEHPNIMTVHDLGIDEDETPFFTMELKDGDDLRKIISEKNQGSQEYLNKYSLNVVLDIFLKVCDAISYAHSKGVVHLDIKPGNVQVGEFGEVLVCDWGLGKIIGRAEIDSGVEMFNSDWLNSMTLTGQVKGTPGYMAPEQVNDGQEKNEQTDIYSLGCLLYTLLTNASPIDGDTSDEILNKTISGQMIPPVQRFPELQVQQSLNAVVMKATSLSQQHRYESVSDLRNEVYNYQAGFATRAENASFLRGLSLLYQRNKLICNLSFSFVLIVVVISAQFIYNLNKTTAEAVTARNDAEKAREEEVIARGLTDAALEKFKEERAISENLSIEVKNIQKRATALSIEKSLIQKATIQQIDYSNPLKSVADKIKDFENRRDTPSRRNILTEYYYISQEFQKGYELNKNREGKYLFNSLQKFKDFQKLSEGVVPIDDFYKVINVNHRELMEKIIVYDAALRKDFTGYEKVIKQLLAIWNKGFEKCTFEYNPQKKHSGSQATI
ncbi:MAG: serine/threonine protein kinase [Lentisphaerales bacterium]|nr:serine/threonine protein kinase [Lentisphaerales bacterium]